MAKKKKATLNIATANVATNVPSSISRTQVTNIEKNGDQNSNPDNNAMVYDSDGEELIHSPLLHPTAGMISRKIHNTIL